MNKDEAYDLIVNYFTEQLEIPREKIKPEVHLFDDLGLDSIDALDMVGMLESEFDLNMEDDELKSIRTVQHVVDFLVKSIPQS